MPKKIEPTPEQQGLLEAMTKAGVEVIEGKKLTPEESKKYRQTHKEVIEYFENLRKFREEYRKVNIMISYQQPSYAT